MILTIVLLSLFLVLSVLVNILLFWYNRQAVEKILFVSDNIGDTVGLIKEYHEHLESLYEMEMFYGDAVLKGLIDHTKFLVNEVRVFENIYSLTREEDDVSINEDDRTETENEEDAPQE